MTKSKISAKIALKKSLCEGGVNNFEKCVQKSKKNIT